MKTKVFANNGGKCKVTKIMVKERRTRIFDNDDNDNYADEDDPSFSTSFSLNCNHHVSNSLIMSFLLISSALFTPPPLHVQ